MLAAWSDFTGRPYGWLMRQHAQWRRQPRHPMINLVVSNVPGPREHLHIAGARIDDIYSVGPILEFGDLNVTAWSYDDQLNISAMACRDHIPDLHQITDGLEAALAELEAVGDQSDDADAQSEPA